MQPAMTILSLSETPRFSALRTSGANDDMVS